jgi:hypothetical protein
MPRLGYELFHSVNFEIGQSLVISFKNSASSISNLSSGDSWLLELLRECSESPRRGHVVGKLVSQILPSRLIESG